MKNTIKEVACQRYNRMKTLFVPFFNNLSTSGLNDYTAEFLHILETLVQTGDTISSDMAALFKNIISNAELNRKFVRGSCYILFISHSKDWLEANPEIMINLSYMQLELLNRNFSVINTPNYESQRDDMIENAIYCMVGVQQMFMNSFNEPLCQVVD